MTFRMGKRAAMEMHLGNKEVYQVRQGEALVYAKQLAVSQTLDGVTSDAPSSVAWGDGMVVTLTATAGNKVQANSVVVMMGGMDVTSSVYNHSTKTITIAEVTGNISITAVGRPYDAEVEYLQGDGTAYIDTDIVLTSAHIIDVDFTYVENQRLIGARKDNSSYASIGIYSKYIDLNATGATVSTGRLTMTLSAGERYNAHAENGKRQYFGANGTLLGQNTHSAASFNTNRKAAIFALRWAADTVTPAVGCIHSLSITYDGSKVLDFIPVRDNGVGYLYDKVSGQLFGNAGSGAFTYGNDK